MNTMRSARCLGTVVILASILIGCADEAPVEVVEQPVLTTEQQSIYETNCKICHGMPGSGAPQTGDIAQWSERIERGMDSMLSNVINGYQGMPAMGSCFDCTDEDLRALSSFMVGGRAR